MTSFCRMLENPKTLKLGHCTINKEALQKIEAFGFCLNYSRNYCSFMVYRIRKSVLAVFYKLKKRKFFQLSSHNRKICFMLLNVFHNTLLLVSDWYSDKFKGTLNIMLFIGRMVPSGPWDLTSTLKTFQSQKIK